MRISVLAAGAALVLLAGCAPEIESGIYVSDVQKVIEGAGPVATPALLRVPQASEDDCKKGLANLIENLKALAPATGKGKCMEQNGDQLAEIETSMILVREGEEAPQPNLFVLEVGELGSGSSLTFRLLKPITEITEALAANSDEMQVDFDPAKFIFRIENDAQGAYELWPNHVFVDGEPGLPDGGPISLDRRNSVEIRFSDVASVYVERANAYGFASIAAR